MHPVNNINDPQAPHEHPPPPYHRTEDDDFDYDSDSATEDQHDNPSPPTLKLLINATKSIQGSNNLVQTHHSSATNNPLWDTTQCTTAILATLKHLFPQTQQQQPATTNQHPAPTDAYQRQHHAANLHQHHPAHPHPRHARAPKIEITINCGTTIIGDRNVLAGGGSAPGNANIAIRPVVPASPQHPPPTHAPQQNHAAVQYRQQQNVRLGVVNGVVRGAEQDVNAVVAQLREIRRQREEGEREGKGDDVKAGAKRRVGERDDDEEGRSDEGSEEGDVEEGRDAKRTKVEE